MSKILVVFGGTGQQGSSVIDSVLNDHELSQKYKIRAITRDIESEKAKQLGQKVEVVKGDALDRPSLEEAFTGAHVVFAMTAPSFTADGFEIEYNNAKTIADVAVEKGLEYIIFSTLPGVTEISGGKYTKISPFDAKAKAEQYIRSLPIASAFVSLGGFMENFHTVPFLGPVKSPDGTWALTRHNSPEAKLPLVCATRDTGKFVGAILADPDKYKGKTFCASTALYSLSDMVAALSKASGKTVVYRQLSKEDFAQTLPMASDVFIQSFAYPEEFGYYGPNSQEKVEWAVQNARGKVTTLDEYFEAYPLRLE